MQFATRALCLAASLTLSSLALANNDSPVGTWKTIDDETKQAKALVQISESGGVLTGKIIAVRQPGRAVRQMRRRAQRQAGARHDHSVGPEKNGDAWEGGKILDPKRPDGAAARPSWWTAAPNWKCAALWGCRCWVARKCGNANRKKHHLTHQALQGGSLTRRFSLTGAGRRFSVRWPHSAYPGELASPHSSMSAHPADPRQHGARQRASIHACQSARADAGKKRASALSAGSSISGLKRRDRRQTGAPFFAGMGTIARVKSSRLTVAPATAKLPVWAWSSRWIWCCTCRCATRTKPASPPLPTPPISTACRSKARCASARCAGSRANNCACCGRRQRRGVAALSAFYPSQEKLCAVGQRLRAVGEVRRGFQGDEMVHPKSTPLATTTCCPRR